MAKKLVSGLDVSKQPVEQQQHPEDHQVLGPKAMLVWKRVLSSE